MKKPTLIALAVLLVALGLGGTQGRHIDHLREARAFYEWLRVAGTSERLFTGESVSLDFRDRQLYEMVTPIAETVIPAPSVSLTPEEGGIIAALAKDDANNQKLWEFAKSDAVADLRKEFLTAARNNKLQFAQNLDYAAAEAANVSIINLFLGFRKVAANLLWIEVDRAWSMGMLQRVTPMMTTVVTLDPNFVDAYLIGAWHLGYNASAKYQVTPPALLEWSDKYQACIGDKERFYYEAAEFLKRGIRYNPRDYRLYFDLGFGIYNEKIQDYEKAVLYLREAVNQPHERWVPRMLYQAYEANGQYEEALAGWKEYQSRFPDSETDTAPRFINRNTALVEERKAEQLRAEAKGKPEAEAAPLREQAREHNAEARRIWKAMNEPYADARILRLEALDLREQGRYLEATAMLQNARQLSGSLHKELSDLIIEIKQEGGIDLAVTEQKQLIRESVVGCEGMPDDMRPS